MADIETRVTSTGEPRYRVRWRPIPGGKREVITFADRTRAEQFRGLVEMAGEAMPSDQQLRAFGFDQLAGDDIAAPAAVTVVDQCHAYVDQLVKPKLRQVNDYRDMIRRHVAPFFGATPITAVNRATLRDWQRWGEREGGHNGKPLSASTVRQVRSGLLLPAFTLACRRQDDGTPGLLSWNPFDGLDAPRVPKNPQQWFRSGDEAALLVRGAYAVDEFTGDAIVMMLATGMRFGEAFGMRRPAVILDGAPPVVEIREVAAVLDDHRGRYRLRPGPKSDDGWRAVPIPAPALAVATRRFELAATAPRQLLFPGPEGDVASYGMWRDRVKAAKGHAAALGLTRLDVTTHGLRHTAITVLGRDGRVSRAALQTTAGHADPKTTAGYTHEGNHPAVAAALGDWLGAVVEGTPAAA